MAVKAGCARRRSRCGDRRSPGPAGLRVRQTGNQNVPEFLVRAGLDAAHGDDCPGSTTTMFGKWRIMVRTFLTWRMVCEVPQVASCRTAFR